MNILIKIQTLSKLEKIIKQNIATEKEEGCWIVEVVFAWSNNWVANQNEKKSTLGVIYLKEKSHNLTQIFVIEKKRQ